MLKFKFETANIPEFCCPAQKTHSFLTYSKDELKTYIKAKGIYNSAIDDDCGKRNKKADELEGGVEISEQRQQQRQIRHQDMKDSVINNTNGPEIVGYTIDCIRESEGCHLPSQTVGTRKHKKKAYAIANNKRIMRDDFHSLALGSLQSRRDGKYF